MPARRPDRSAAARYLEIGHRVDGDNALYPDDDLMWCEDEAGVFAAHKDGRRYAATDSGAAD